MNHIFSVRADKLYTPGPVNIPERVYVASMLGSYHHRSKEFSNIMTETLNMLQPLFGTEQLVMPVHATGRGALEGIYSNVFTASDRVVVIVNGKFGEMAAATLKRCGINALECFSGWDEPVDLVKLENSMVDFKATGLVSVFNDTSNGIINPIDKMGKIARKLDALFVVDDVSGLACMPFKMDEWGVDAVATASQKGLMSPVGLSFVAMSPKALDAAEANPQRDFYIDFVDIRKNLLKKSETPGSTPVSLMVSVHEALNIINEEGLDNVFLRHKAISHGTKAALSSLGFSLYPFECETRSDSLSVARVPEGISAKKLAEDMHDRFHLKIGTGLGDMGNDYIRIAHMGYCYAEDMLECLSALECQLHDYGVSDVFGKGTSSFIRVYESVIAFGWK